MRLVWNTIVKNESARIERCVNSLLPHVDGGIVVDTGSTDGTPERIKELFGAANKPVEVHHAKFENFSQARNEALKAARDSNLPWQYLLLMDADMQLVASKPDWFNGASGLSYDMRQVAGGISYWNRRLLSRNATGNYVGVTHEYLDVGTAGAVDQAYFIDHADGANRPDKFQRDVDLLTKALETETDRGLIQRYHFYLAQSYFDSGNWVKAAEYYKKRVELGGWDEEVWNAQLHYAHCLGNLNDHAGFVYQALCAYEMRPTRAEALYDLAKFFREAGGSNYRSLLFSTAGLDAQRPADVLFVNDGVYTHGLREEYSICAYYDPDKRAEGARICNELALDRSAGPLVREQARANQFWYLEPLSARVPSFRAAPIRFKPPDGYAAMNPSLINYQGTLIALIRTVNYKITPEGRYVSRKHDDSIAGIDIIRTRNFLARLSGHDGMVDRAAEIQLPDLPPPKFELVRGFEDSRLFEWHGRLWTLSTVRELTPQGWCEQVLAPVEDHGDKLCYGAWKRISPIGEKRNEKNWMPWPCNGDLRFVYRLGTILDVTGAMIHSHQPTQALEHVSGGSQMVKIKSFDGGFYLALVHEARHIPGRVTRYYQHRFVLMDEDGKLLDISDPFFFHDRQIEFAAGLARVGDELLISYGVRDEEAWIARMRLDEVLGFCE